MFKRKKKIICRHEKCLFCIIIVLTLQGMLSTFVEKWQPFHRNCLGPVWGWNVPLFYECFHVLSTGPRKRPRVTRIALEVSTLFLESPASASESLADQRPNTQGAPHCWISAAGWEELNMVEHAYDLSTGRWMQKDQEFKVSFSCVRSMGLAWATLDFVSKTKSQGEARQNKNLVKSMEVTGSETNHFE